MAVTFYSSLDTGAPLLTGDFFNKIRSILTACLVDGYGAKPAAGWSIAHSHPEGVGFSNGEGVFFIAFYDSIRMWGGVIESVSGSSEKFPDGNNRQYGGMAAESGGNLGGANPHWYVVADDKTAILMFGGGIAGSDTVYAGSGNQCTPLYFGRYVHSAGLAPAFCMLGWGESNPPWVGRLGCLTSNVFGYVLRNPRSGLIELGTRSRLGLGVPGLTRQNSFRDLAFPDVSRLYFLRSAVVGFGPEIPGAISSDNAVICGWARGVLIEPALSSYRLARVLEFFGAPDQWQERVKPITLPNGKQVVPMFTGPRDLGYFVSLDEEDWS